MPKFKCLYIYDVPHYSQTIVVEAADQQAAEDQMKAALTAGKFYNLECKVGDENENERVMVYAEAPADARVDDLDNLY